MKQYKKAGGNQYPECPRCHKPMEKRTIKEARCINPDCEICNKPLNFKTGEWKRPPVQEDAASDETNLVLAEDDPQTKTITYVSTHRGDTTPVSAHIEPSTESPKPNWFDAIPAELREWAQWVCWRYGTVDLKTGKRRKIPFDAKQFAPLYGCDYSALSSCASFEQALARYEESQKWKMPYDGIGFCFFKHDPFTGIDGDHCRDKETGELNEYAKTNLVLGIVTYWEVSPSEEGIKGITKGSIPANIHTDLVEMYDCERFFTITGKRLPDVPATIENQDEQVNALYQQSVPTQRENNSPPSSCSSICSDDQELVARAMNARNRAGEEFSALYKNDVATWRKWYSKKDGSPDYSRADWHLIKYLKFYTGDDRERVEKLCWASALARPKWDRKCGRGKTYLQRTIEQAIPPVRTKPSPSDPVEVAS